MECGVFFSFDRRMVCGGDGGMPYSRHDVFGTRDLTGMGEHPQNSSSQSFKGKRFLKGAVLCCAQFRGC